MTVQYSTVQYNIRLRSTVEQNKKIIHIHHTDTHTASSSSLATAERKLPSDVLRDSCIGDSDGDTYAPYDCPYAPQWAGRFDVLRLESESESVLLVFTTELWRLRLLGSTEL